MQLCIMFRNLNVVDNKYGRIMGVNTFYKTDSFEKRRNISITLEDMASF
jgi:hypothetical protein